MKSRVFYELGDDLDHDEEAEDDKSRRLLSGYKPVQDKGSPYVKHLQIDKYH